MSHPWHGKRVKLSAKFLAVSGREHNTYGFNEATRGTVVRRESPPYLDSLHWVAVLPDGWERPGTWGTDFWELAE